MLRERSCTCCHHCGRVLGWLQLCSWGTTRHVFVWVCYPQAPLHHSLGMMQSTPGPAEGPFSLERLVTRVVVVVSAAVLHSPAPLLSMTTHNITVCAAVAVSCVMAASFELVAVAASGFMWRLKPTGAPAQEYLLRCTQLGCCSCGPRPARGTAPACTALGSREPPLWCLNGSSPKCAMALAKHCPVRESSCQLTSFVLHAVAHMRPNE